MASMNANLGTDAKYAFVIAERQKYVPGIGSHVQANWQDFLKIVQDTGHLPADCTTIHENIWLIPLATGLPFVSELIQAGAKHSVAIRILFLNDTPTWLKYPPDDEAKPSQPTP
jgi:hypothetical protein